MRRDEPHGARLSWMARIALAFAPLSLLFYVWEQADFLHGRLSRGQVFGRDFMNYWTGARLLLHGDIHALFTQAEYGRAVARIWGPGMALHSFSYPPSLFPFIAWTGALDYGTAIILWSLAGLALLLAASWPGGRRLPPALLLMLSPAVAVCLDDGQNGLLTGALIVGGLRLSERRPWIGGVLIGMATFKPQLGLLIPLALIAAGRWRTIAAAAAGAAALGAASLLMGGAESWRLYLTQAAPYQRMLLEHSTGTFQVMMPSPFMAGRLAGLSLAASYALQAAASAASAALVFIRFRGIGRSGRRIGPLDIAVLLAAGFMASPYGFNYDMPGLAAALLLADRASPDLDRQAAWRWGAAALWSAPLLTMLVPLALGWRGGPTWPIGPGLAAIGLGLTAMARPGPEVAAAAPATA